jgi:hypothetical protein
MQFSLPPCTFDHLEPTSALPSEMPSNQAVSKTPFGGINGSSCGRMLRPSAARDGRLHFYAPSAATPALIMNWGIEDMLGCLFGVGRCWFGFDSRRHGSYRPHLHLSLYKKRATSRCQTGFVLSFFLKLFIAHAERVQLLPKHPSLPFHRHHFHQHSGIQKVPVHEAQLLDRHCVAVLASKGSSDTGRQCINRARVVGT